VLLSLTYALLRLLLDLLLVRFSAASIRDAELLALRHEVRVLRRQTKRVAWRSGDRLIVAALSRCLPRPEWHVFPVRPEPLLRWHRALVRRRWAAFGRRRGPGRPPLPTDVVDLVVRLARENPRWGYQRITGELFKVGHHVPPTAVRTILRRHRVPPAPRRAGLAWPLVLSARHLEQVLREYGCHYNRARPHRALALRAPLARGQPFRGGAVVRRDRLGGLIHEDDRAAA
jgi:putative transposase